MATPLKYTDENGNTQTVNIDPSHQVIITLPSDSTEASVKFVSPNYETTADVIGGRPKRD